MIGYGARHLAVCALLPALAACGSSTRRGDSVAVRGDPEQHATAGAARDSARSTAVSDSVVTPEGYAGIHPPVALATLSQRLGETLHASYEDGGECTYVFPAALPRGVRLMVVHDTVVRIDIDTTGVRTARGVQVGDSERVVLERYAGRTKVTPHPYTAPKGHYITVDATGDTLHRIIFETDGRKVTTYRTGVRPMVNWIEGCS